MKRGEQYQNRIGYRWATIGSGILFVACLLIFDKSFVCAAPAELRSESAVVYEAADVNSKAVGNLVQGNTFDLKETVTAENGETWRLVAMSNGVQGYMKGEIADDTGNNVSDTPPEGENAGAQAPAGENGGTDAAAAENAGADVPPDGEEALPEDGDSAGTADAPSIGSNTRGKTYAMKADAGRIRVQLPPVDNPPDSPAQKFEITVDKTLLLLLCVAFLSIVLLIDSYKKLKRLFSGSQNRFYGRSGSESQRARKRKRTKKAKKKRAAKEAKKWKNNSLQK